MLSVGGVVMRTFRSVLYLIACIGVAACSMHPLPDDVSPQTTFSIVNNIRCEVKEQVRKRLQEEIDQSDHPKVRQIRAENVLTPANLNTLKRYAPRVAIKISKYQAIIIGYDFEFDITEENRNNVNRLGFKWPLMNTKVGLNLDGHANFTRTAKRTFAISNLFQDLALLDCDHATVEARNLLYPITGSIGAAKIIDTYLDLGKSGVHGDAPIMVPGRHTTIGPFVDEIEFTTEIEGNTDPTITITAVPNHFRLINATAKFLAKRKDFHSVTIAIAFPTIDDRVFQPVILTPREVRKALAESNKIVAEEFCIRRARREERERLETLVPGTILVDTTQDPPLIFCEGARLR